MKTRYWTSALIALAFAGAANAQVYLCDVTNPSPDGWMGSKMYFEIKDGTAIAYDPYIHKIHDQPIEVKLKDAGEFWKMTWTLRGLSSSNQGSAGPTKYRVLVGKTNMKLRINVSLSGYDNSPRGTGVCKLEK